MGPLKNFPFWGFVAFCCLTTFVFCDEEEKPKEKAEKAGSILDPFSDSDKAELKKNSESHQFQAEVNRLMDIIINSLYSQKEVFLRELISNAADALEKARFMSVSNQTYTDANPNFEIRIEADDAAKTVTIQDTGVGMTKQELVNNLGTVARSGTTNFLEAIASGQDLNLIGQFGVGFYSTFLVADKVTVISKSFSDPVQHVWESTADASFTIAPDPRGNTLGRGTRVVLHLKDDSMQFLNANKLIQVVTKFNQFVNFPIYVKTEKREVETVPFDTEIEGDLEEYPYQDKAPKEGEETENRTKKVYRKSKVWEHINQQKPIWMRSKDSVNETEYHSFYKDVLRDYADPVSYIHFNAEGEVDFKSILYIPRDSMHNDWTAYFNSKQNSIKLYSRRVLVADEMYELVPKWLSFIKGVVDSDDLPLKVDRESFAQTKMMKVITKKVVAKFVEMVKKLSKEDKDEWDKYKEDMKDPEQKEGDKKDSEKSKDEEKAKDDSEKDKEKKSTEMKDKGQKNATVPDTKFARFWKTFNKNMKMGCIDDKDHRDKITPVFRWHTTKTTMNESITLDEYVNRMPEDQKEILFVAHDNFDAAMRLPYVQLYKKKGWDLIVASDPLDETCLQKIGTFRTKVISSVERTSVKLSQTDDEKKRFKKIEKAYKPLTSWMKSRLAKKIGNVQMSQKLVDDPATVSTDAQGLTAYTDRVVKSQSFATYKADSHNKHRVLELNPNHPLIIKLLEMVEADKEDPQAETAAETLLETAMLASGFSISDPSYLVKKLVESMRKETGVANDAVVEEFVVPEGDATEEEVEEETKEKSEEDISDMVDIQVSDKPPTGEGIRQMTMDDFDHFPAEKSEDEMEEEEDAAAYDKKPKTYIKAPSNDEEKVDGAASSASGEKKVDADADSKSKASSESETHDEL